MRPFCSAWLTLLLAAGFSGAAARSHAQVALPDFTKQNYEPSRRDPLIDPAAPATLFGGPVANARAIGGGDSLRKLLATMSEQIRSLLVVGGVAFSPDGSGRALISGLDMATGDFFIFQISPELNSQILGVMRSYSVDVRRITLPDKSDALVLVVGRIKPASVELHLPGFPNPICTLQYDPKLGLTSRKLRDAK